MGYTNYDRIFKFKYKVTTHINMWFDHFFHKFQFMFDAFLQVNIYNFY